MSLEIFEEMKTFVGFSQIDRDNLVKLKPTFHYQIPRIAEEIQGTLKRIPATAELTQGKNKGLKHSHIHWMNRLFEGEYGEDYFLNRRDIGVAHVGIRLPPHFVEGIMSHVRSRAFEIILDNQPDSKQAIKEYDSILKILDLDLLIINNAYRDERLDRIFNITGISRPLVERLIEQGGAATTH